VTPTDASNNNPQKYYESNVVGRSCTELITHEVPHDKYDENEEFGQKNHKDSAKFAFIT